MKRTAIIMAAVFTLCCCAAAVDAGMQPEIVLIEQNPWLMVVGSDSPTFALYNTGLLIFVQNKRYESIVLTPAEKEELLKGLDLKGFARLKDNYQNFDNNMIITDLPTNFLFVRKGNKLKRVSVYGVMRDKQGNPKYLPQAYIDIFNRISEYKNKKAKKWMPDEIEVMLWPYDYSPEKPKPWPKEWLSPGLARIVKKHDDFYQIFLKNSQSKKLRSFFRGMKEKQAILFLDKKWSVDSRYPFPGEKDFSFKAEDRE